MLQRSANDQLSLQDIRQKNAARIFHALRVSPDLSQRDLVDQTSIDQATVSVIINALVDNNIVARKKETSQGKVGRPRTALSISKDTKILMGASIEPNAVNLVATYLDGELIDRITLDTANEMKPTLERVYKAAKDIAKNAGFSTKQIVGIGIGCPVVFDVETQQVWSSRHIDWPKVNISTLTKQFDVPFLFDNDANTGALAEKYFGNCQNIDNFLFVGGPWGIGGALFIDGRSYKGSSGYGGEIGHMTVAAHGRQCGCGKYGCLEAYASEKSILARLAERGTELDDIHEVALLAKHGHQFANHILYEAGDYLGLALSNVTNFFNPECIVLGSEMMRIAPLVRDQMQFSLRENTMKGLEPNIILSSLGRYSVAMGGAAHVLESFLHQPTGLIRYLS